MNGDRVTWGRAYETMVVPAPLEQRQTVMLLRRCANDVGLSYWCEPCEAKLPHLEALALHLDELTALPHRIAFGCPSHADISRGGDTTRWEAANDQQMRALVGVAA